MSLQHDVFAVLQLVSLYNLGALPKFEFVVESPLSLLGLYRVIRHLNLKTSFLIAVASQLQLLAQRAHLLLAKFYSCFH